jgi:hypothetical protein
MNICECCTEPFDEDSEKATFILKIPHGPPYQRVVCQECAEGYRRSSHATERRDQSHE